jgi:hypothetical protein
VTIETDGESARRSGTTAARTRRSANWRRRGSGAIIDAYRVLEQRLGSRSFEGCFRNSVQFTLRSTIIHMGRIGSRTSLVSLEHLQRSPYSLPEPDRTTWSFPHQIKLTFGRRSRRLHQHPACGGWGSKGRDHSSIRLFRPYDCAVRPPGSTRTDQVLEDLRARSTSVIRRPAPRLRQ